MDRDTIAFLVGLAVALAAVSTWVGKVFGHKVEQGKADQRLIELGAWKESHERITAKRIADLDQMRLDLAVLTSQVQNLTQNVNRMVDAQTEMQKYIGQMLKFLATGTRE